QSTPRSLAGSAPRPSSSITVIGHLLVDRPSPGPGRLFAAYGRFDSNSPAGRRGPRVTGATAGEPAEGGRVCRRCVPWEQTSRDAGYQLRDRPRGAVARNAVPPAWRSQLTAGAALMTVQDTTTADTTPASVTLTEIAAGKVKTLLQQEG